MILFIGGLLGLWGAMSAAWFSATLVYVGVVFCRTGKLSALVVNFCTFFFFFYNICLDWDKEVISAQQRNAAGLGRTSPLNQIPAQVLLHSLTHHISLGSIKLIESLPWT